jgi:hypothetical protein
MAGIDRQESPGDAMAAHCLDTGTGSGGMVPPGTPQSASEPESECQAPVATSAKDQSSRPRSFWRRWIVIGVVVAVVLVGGIVAGAVLATRSHSPSASGGNGNGDGAGGQTLVRSPCTQHLETFPLSISCPKFLLSATLLSPKTCRWDSKFVSALLAAVQFHHD